MKVNYITGNYRIMYERFLKGVPLDHGEQEDTKRQLSLDVPRTGFVGSDAQYEDFCELWLQHPPKVYLQGDMFGGTILPAAIQKHMFDRVEELGIEINKKLAEYQNDGKVLTCSEKQHLRALRSEQEQFDLESQSLSSSRFAYMNDQNQPAGICITLLPERPECWAISVLSNSAAELEQRIVTVFFSDQMSRRFSLDEADYIDLMANLQTAVGSNQIFGLLQKIISPTGKIFIKAAKALDPVVGKNTRVEDLTMRLNFANLEVAVSSLQNKGFEMEGKRLSDLLTFLQLQNKKFLTYTNQELQDQLEAIRNNSISMIQCIKNYLHYDAWDKTVVNLLLAIALVGILYLACCAVKYLFTGNFLLYSPQSEEQQLLDVLQNDIKNIFVL